MSLIWTSVLTLSACRLNDAYHYYKESVRGGKFIYDESLVLPEDAAVLDVGTGSGQTCYFSEKMRSLTV